jgi:hypothetical protein
MYAIQFWWSLLLQTDRQYAASKLLSLAHVFSYIDRICNVRNSSVFQLSTNILLVACLMFVKHIALGAHSSVVG